MRRRVGEAQHLSSVQAPPDASHGQDLAQITDADNVRQCCSTNLGHLRITHSQLTAVSKYLFSLKFPALVGTGKLDSMARGQHIACTVALVLLATQMVHAARPWSSLTDSLQSFWGKKPKHTLFTSPTGLFIQVRLQAQGHPDGVPLRSCFSAGLKALQLPAGGKCGYAQRDCTERSCTDLYAMSDLGMAHPELASSTRTSCSVIPRPSKYHAWLQERASKQLPGPGQHYSFGSLKPWQDVHMLLESLPGQSFIAL